MTTNELKITKRTKVRRAHQRGSFNRDDINAILDAMPLCHVGYTVDGKPAVTPTLQWREGSHVYWHGSSASRFLKNSRGLDVCLTVTLMDGFVMARSAFHHSANYRSVMIYGTATQVTDPELKAAHLKIFVEQLTPGRWDILRPMNDKELKATMLLSMPIEEASAKIRAGGPVDDDEDYDLPIWAGVVPITQQLGAPVDDERNLPGLKVPAHIGDIKIG